jgi:hypothetical protein
MLFVKCRRFYCGERIVDGGDLETVLLRVQRVHLPLLPRLRVTLVTVIQIEGVREVQEWIGNLLFQR